MGVAVAERVSSLTERLLAAQRVLAAAEAAAGMRTALPGPGSTWPPADALPAADAPGPIAGGPAGERVDRPPAVSDRFLPVPDALVPLVPSGGVRRGSAVQVKGSTSLLLALAAAACRDGAWCAVVGLPDLGLASAREHGLALERVALVPAPGADTPGVLSAAIDGFDVVVLGDVPHLVERDRRRLASRLRQREAVLLTTTAWPGVELTISMTRSSWGGLGQGHGSLRGREATIRVGGRGAAGGRGVQARLHSPDGVRLVLDGRVAEVPTPEVSGPGARLTEAGAGGATAFSGLERVGDVLVAKAG
jgi:hypothetical protein